MINNWVFCLVTSLFFVVIFHQFYKLSTQTAKKDGAMTILLQFIGGLSILIWLPLFPIQFPTDIKVYGLLTIACVFYAVNDRLQTTARKHLQVSLFSIVNQLSNVFLILIGLTVFREPFLISKILGAGFILFANVFLVYDGGKLKINKYIWVVVAANFAFAVAISTDIGISKYFNLPFYVAFTLIVPAIIIFLVEKITIKEIADEYKRGVKKYLYVTGFAWSLCILFALRAYQLGKITVIVPLQGTSVLITIIISYLFLHERSNLIKKIIAALLVFIGVYLTVQGF